ncbi:MAG: glycoside hydrolase family 38 C-terminal domain-containing protein [Acidobacteriota bacterium]|nr:glycoside hydrolase family 38 C-terminal domain-containing protein [Acidobacteriota bacterium]
MEARHAMDTKARTFPRGRRPAVHLICGAHLDPVWQWRWEEGASEAVATFRVAAGILAEHPDLVFCHNEAVLYRFVERLDPALFRRIVKLVRAGRWSIAGGWHLQPDANLPGIESVVRQIAEGRRYFRERFGMVPRVAYNFDSFGHGAGLPQVLRRAGYEMYIHMRPQVHELALPSDLFRWRGMDGSEILACRIAVGLYHTEYDNIEERLRAGVELAMELGRDVPVFWGIGDHGGGPTRRDLARIDSFRASEHRVRILHSTPERFYAAVAAAGRTAPIVTGDLQRCFTGCFTSLARLKRRAQTNLGLLVQTEALRTAAWWTTGLDYPTDKLAGAWRAHLFNDFHDILPGSCIEPAERDALDLYGKSEAEARCLRLDAAAAFARGLAEAADIPLTVLNANPALARVPVEAEFMIEHRPKWTGTWRSRLIDAAGREAVCQEEQPEALLPFNGWRRKISFMAALPGVGPAGYEIRPVEEPAQAPLRPERSGDIRLFRSPRWSAVGPRGEIRPWKRENGLWLGSHRRTGRSAFLRTSGRGLLAGPWPGLLAVEDDGDAWGTDRWRYRRIAGEFKPSGPARIIERGPVRTILESKAVFKSSRVVLHTIFYPSWPAVELRLRVHWNEEKMRLKLAFPTSFRDAQGLLCEVPGGAVVRPADGDEHVHGRWCMAEGRLDDARTAFGIAHVGLHGLDFKAGEIRLSALRGSAYCHEQGFKLDPARAYKFADQGVHDIRLALTAGTPEEVRRVLPGLADWLSAPPAVYAHLPFGRGDAVADGGSTVLVGREPEANGQPLPSSLLMISAPNVHLLACKRSDDGKALILRLQESAGRKTKARLSVARPAGKGTEPIEIGVSLAPFEMKTIRVERTGRWRSVDLIEER